MATTEQTKLRVPGPEGRVEDQSEADIVSIVSNVKGCEINVIVSVFLVLPYPLFDLMLFGASLGTIIEIQIALALGIALYSGPGPAAIAEIFTTRGRSTWMSTGYSLSVAMFGGFAPFVATWLIEKTGSLLSPAYYVMAAAAASMVVILRLEESAGKPLR
jgi:MHS family proline/betaine transporter-like MFS transporter